MMSSKLSWKQDLRPNSYCTDVRHQQRLDTDYNCATENVSKSRKQSYPDPKEICNFKCILQEQIKEQLLDKINYVKVHTEDAGKNHYMPNEILSAYLIMFVFLERHYVLFWQLFEFKFSLILMSRC
jgi:hypothetical protein